MENSTEFIKKVVPEMVLKKARETKWFDEQEVEDIENFNGDTFQEYANKAENEDFILIEEASHGGYEGAGEDTWVVYSLNDKKSNERIYFQINGWYNSWDATEWADIIMVEPKEVIVIKWSKI